MKALGALVARNAKAVVSVVGGLVNLLAVSAALFEFAPAQYAGVGTALMAALEAARNLNVWLVRNEPAIVSAADTIASSGAA